jgi:hypothetical protein
VFLVITSLICISCFVVFVFDQLFLAHMGEPRNFVSRKPIKFSVLITTGTLDLTIQTKRKKKKTLIHKLKRETSLM